MPCLLTIFFSQACGIWFAPTNRDRRRIAKASNQTYIGTPNQQFGRNVNVDNVDVDPGFGTEDRQEDRISHFKYIKIRRDFNACTIEIVYPHMALARLDSSGSYKASALLNTGCETGNWISKSLVATLGLNIKSVTIHELLGTPPLEYQRKVLKAYNSNTDSHTANQLRAQRSMSPNIYLPLMK